MTNKKSTKKALLFSVLSLVLCFSMLVGTTFAWFTDSVTSANNIIASGNLDVELYFQVEGQQDWTKVTANTNIFKENALWEPGHTEVVKLKVVNEGSLALKYSLSVNVASEIGSVNANGTEFKLSNYIKYAIIDGAQNYTREEAVAAAENAKATTLANAYNSGTTTLLPKTDSNTDNEDIVTMVVYMPTTVGNEANAAKDAVKPSINLGINLFATQVEAESDSFGPDYDANAPIVSAPVARPSTGTATDINLKGDNDVVIALPAEVIEDLPSGVTEIGMSVSEPVVDTAAKTITFATIELVDQNKNVIDLEALNLGEKITVTLPVGDAFANGETVVIYHDGEYMAAAVVTDGFIRYEADHFCEVSVGTVKAPTVNGNTVEIANAAELFGFAQEVNSGKNNYYAGKTVVLTNDIDLKNAEWTPIGSAVLDHGFMGNFDGDGYTIYNLCIKNIKLDADGYAYAGFFGITEGAEGAENYIKNLKIENVTINTTGHIVAAAIAYPYYTTLENITVCGNIAINGGDYTAGALAYTRRCTTASNVTVSGKEGSYITGRDTVGGVISDIQMNGGLTANYSDFSASNLTITGDNKAGGISGIIGGQTLNGATVEDVTLVCSDARVGIVAGSYDNKPVINNAVYSNVTGATAVAGAPWGSESNGIVTIDGVEYAGNLETFKAQLETGTVNLACNIALNETVTIASGKTVVINLNGNTISYVSTTTGANQSAIVVGKDGNLTIKNGTVTMKHEGANMYWDNSTNVLEAVSGGILTIENVHVKNLGGSDMAYAVNVGNNGGATFTAKASTIESVNYTAFRVFNNADGAINVTFTDGTKLTGESAPFFVHFWTVADLGNKQAARQEYLTVNFNDTEVSRYSGSKSLVRFGFTDAIYYSNTAMTEVVAGNVKALEWATVNGKNILMNDSLTFNASETTANSGYGATGVKVAGTTFDGNGKTLTVNGAWNTWDCAVNTTGGTIKNLTINSAMRGIFMGGATADVYIDNVVIDGTIYTFNSDGGNKEYGVYISNTTLNGWTSHSDVHKEVVYKNCNFGEGNGYAFCRPYGKTVLENCVFEEGFEFDTACTSDITFINCYYGETLITVENAAELGNGETTFFYNGLNGITIQ